MSFLTHLPESERRRRLIWFVGFFAVLSLLVLGRYVFNLIQGVAGPAGPRPVPVRAAEVTREDMPRLLSALGTVQPSGAVLVRSRVDGQLMKLYFAEGQHVKEGDLLAQIDPRVFENALREAQGQLAKDKALLENAKRDLARYAQLSKGDYIAEQQVETQRALVRQYEGVVRSDEAQVAAAALQLEYSRITAPMDGTLGLRQVDEGNMIRASDTSGLVRLTRTSPSDVVFTLPEAELPVLMAGMKEAKEHDTTLPVYAWDRDQKQLLATGSLLSVDNQIDPGTGTVKLKARFDNTDNTLFPNQFVNVRLQVHVRKDATVAPAAAVQLGAQGSYVYVVEDGKAKLTPVKLGWRGNNKVLVEEGLMPGQQVVVDGVDRLRNNAPIALAQPEKAPPAK